MASVVFEKVVKKYSEEAVILRGIDLEIKDGEFVVLVGPSGCGKSTLLRTVAGLETINGGTIRIGERTVNNLPPKDRDIAMVFQSYALYPHMTARENMAFGLKVRKMTAAEIDKRVNDAAEMLGITHLLERLPKEMSGGQRQRVAMGRAIVRRPKVFLFDEPLSNLDAALRTQMRVELKRLHERLNTTIIYVTHDQVEAMTLADRIVVLNSGVLQQVGTPEELYLRPANSFVARFIGSPSMNLITCSCSHDHFSSAGITGPCSAGIGRNEFIAGVRPGDLSRTSGDVTFEGTVEIAEVLGSQALVHCVLPDGTPFTAEISMESARGIASGDSIQFSAAADRMHFFEKESGLRISK